MPSDYRLARIQCNLDREQEPEQWTCSWIGTVLPEGDILGENVSFDVGDDVEDEMTAWLTANDLVLV